MGKNSFMKSNTNKKIIYYLAIKALINEKMKIFFVGLIIILAATFLTVTMVLGQNAVNTSNNERFKVTGFYQAIGKNFTEEQILSLEKDERVESVGVYEAVGNAAGRYGEKINFVFCNKMGLELNATPIIKGELPQKENEILVESDYGTVLNRDINIGDKLTFEVENIKTKELRSEEFVVTGFIETIAHGKARNLYGAIVSEEYVDKNLELNSANIFIRINNSNKENMEEKLGEIAQDFDIEGSQFVVNQDYLNATEPGVGVVFAIITILIIILGASFIVIYSLFYISVVGKIKTYGQLSTIGMTKNQILKMIKIEGNVLTLTLVPLGIIIGILISKIVVPSIKVDATVAGICIVVFVLLGLTVRMSVKKPAKIAAEKSAVEAAAFVKRDDVTNRKKELKISSGILGWINFKKDKKKAFLTILSLGISGTLFLFTATIISSMNANDMARQGFRNCEIKVSHSANLQDNKATNEIQMENPLDEELINKIEQIPEVSRVERKFTVLSQINNSYLEGIVGFNSDDREIFQKYLLDGKLDGSPNTLIIGNLKYLQDEYGIKDIHAGDKITLGIYDGNEIKQIQFEIGAILEEKIVNDFGYSSLLMSNEYFDLYSTHNTISEIDISLSDPDNQEAYKKVQIALESNKNIQTVNYLDAIKQNEMLISMTKGIISLIEIFLFIFALINLINTMVTSVIVQRRDIGIMQAVGMGKNQVIRMLQTESLVYTILSLGVTTVFGGLLGVIGFYVLKNTGMSYLKFRFPISELLIFALILVVIDIMLSICISYILNKNSIIDQMEYKVS